LGLATPSQAKGPVRSSYTLPGDAVFPEGIAYQKSTGQFYVSSTTDGTIFRAHLRDEAASVFLPGGQDGRTTAVGLKVDDEGRLFIATGALGKVYIYDTATGALLAQLSNGLAPSATFVNDIAITKDGVAYATDSVSPYLYRIAQNEAGEFTLERFIDFTGTPLQYQSGFNLNGIAASQNGKYLIVVQSNTGRLFRIEIATKQVTPIDLGGVTLNAGDGILLRGRSLYVVRNAVNLIVKVRLSGDLTSGSVVSETTDPSFITPTTIAEARGRLLVVNSQFNNRGGTPVLPFTVSSIKTP
jgi:Cu-Zn family superoxide dismutase